MAHWLLKTEPSVFSFADLVKARKTSWDGVANAAALLNMRKMKKGDLAVIYHTGGEKQAVGLATITSEAYPDPKEKDPKLVTVDIEAGKALGAPVELSTLKADRRFADSALIRIGRLSVVPLTAEQYGAIVAYGKNAP